MLLATLRRSVASPYAFQERTMKPLLSLGLAALLAATAVAADKVDPAKVAAWLEQPILAPDTTLHETHAYCRAKVRPWTHPTSLAEWESARQRMRDDVLRHVVFRGEAAAWRDAKVGVEYLDQIDGGPGYSIRKLRYEALPGLWIPALLYIPDKLSGKVPAALHVNGHDRNGKAADYKQLRCIHLVKQGMLVLNAEWLGMGQLFLPNFVHYRMNQLDLCGASGLAPFYLAMSRALDLLLAQPNADPQRVAVAGLSGGGWQTIIISSLDERVTLANPVAGYSSFLTRIGVSADLGDSEQTPVDLAKYADYFHLTAMRAPRPTLLTYNAKDNCCFVANSALPPLLEVAGPLYKLYGKPENLRSHVNDEPGDHNFGLDNRRAYYRMLADHFFADQTFPVDEDPELINEVKTAEELNVPLPDENADFHTLALRLAESLPRRPDVPASDPQRAAWRRELATNILRWPQDDSRTNEGTSEAVDGVTIRRRTLRLGGSWSVPIVELSRGEPNSTSLLLGDAGRKSLSQQAAKALEEGRRVVALDPFYFGECALGKQDFLYGLLLSSVGDRPLGLQAAQVAAVAKRIRQERPQEPLRLESYGPRTSLIALCAAAVEPDAVSELVPHDAMSSLKDVLTQNKSVNEAPELFTFGLLEFTDVPQLKAACGKAPAME
jgi:hypothetical protein